MTIIVSVLAKTPMTRRERMIILDAVMPAGEKGILSAVGVEFIKGNLKITLTLSI